jgi:hypothetical protein
MTRQTKASHSPSRPEPEVRIHLPPAASQQRTMQWLRRGLVGAELRSREERIGARIARLRRSSLSFRDRLRFVVDRLLAENAAVEFAGGGVDDDVLPSGAHTRILPLAVMMTRATYGEPAFDLVAPAPLFAGFGAQAAATSAAIAKRRSSLAGGILQGKGCRYPPRRIFSAGVTRGSLIPQPSPIEWSAQSFNIGGYSYIILARCPAIREQSSNARRPQQR